MNYFRANHFRANHFLPVTLLILTIIPPWTPEPTGGGHVGQIPSRTIIKEKSPDERLQREDEEILIIIKVIALCS